MESLRVAVAMGGVSSERDVSLLSGQQVLRALRDVGHDAVGVDLRREAIDDLLAAHPDVVFMALHGRFGEDGGAQALLEQSGVAFTGSGSEASRIGMDKAATKRVFSTYGVPTPAWQVVKKTHQWGKLSRAVGQVGLPLVVKPTRQGSSIGVTVVNEVDEVVDALRTAFEYGPEALIERKVEGRELTVGVLDDRTLPIIEVRPRREFFDQEAKYSDPETAYVVAPDLDELTAGVAREAALRAHQAIGARDYSRVDVFLGDDGRPYVLEVNTIPGMTDHSLLPKAARAEGMCLGELCDRLVQLAWQRTASGALVRA